MYKYLIDGVEVVFNSYEERVIGLDEAEANNLSIEFISDDSSTVKSEEEVKEENIIGKPGFLPDAAKSADVVSEMLPAQDMESNLENGSLELNAEEKRKKFFESRMGYSKDKYKYLRKPKEEEYPDAQPIDYSDVGPIDDLPERQELTKGDINIIDEKKQNSAIKESLSVANKSLALTPKELEFDSNRRKEVQAIKFEQVSNVLNPLNIIDSSSIDSYNNVINQNPDLVSDLTKEVMPKLQLPFEEVEQLVGAYIDNKAYIAKENTKKETANVINVFRKNNNLELTTDIAIAAAAESFSEDGKKVGKLKDEINKLTIQLKDNNALNGLSDIERTLKVTALGNQLIKKQNDLRIARYNYEEGSYQQAYTEDGNFLDTKAIAALKAQGEENVYDFENIYDQEQGYAQETISDYDALKENFTYNYIRQTELKAEGEKLIWLKPLKEDIYFSNKRSRLQKRLEESQRNKDKDGYLGYTVKELATLANRGSLDLENDFEAKKETGYTIKSLQEWAVENRRINIQKRVLEDMFIMGINPASLKEDYVPRFFESAIEATPGGQSLLDKTGYVSNRKQKDQTQEFFNQAGIEATTEQTKAFERGTAMKYVENMGAFMPVLAEFAAINYVTGGISGAVGLTRFISKALTSGSRFERIGAHFINGMIEEGKFEIITGGEAKTGTGFGFYGGGVILGKLLPFRFTGSYASLNKSYEKIVLSGAGGATASEVASVTEAFIESAEGNKSLKRSFDDLFGDDSDWIERVAISFLSFSTLGSVKLTKTDLSKIPRVEDLNRQASRDMFDLSKSEKEREKAKEKYMYTSGILKMANKNLDGKTIGDLKKENEELNNELNKDDAFNQEQNNSLDSNNFTKFTPFELKERNNKQSQINKNQAKIQKIEKEINNKLKNLKDSGIGEIEEYKLSELEGDTKAEISKDGKEVTIDPAKYTKGTLEQEIGHALFRATAKSNPKILFDMVDIMGPSIEKAFKDAEIFGKDTRTYKQIIKEAYPDATPEKLAEEYVMNVVEEFKNEKFTRRLLNENLPSTLKRDLFTIAKNRGFPGFKDVKGLNLNENNLTRVSELLDFMHSVANMTGKSFSINQEILKNTAANTSKTYDILSGTPKETTAMKSRELRKNLENSPEAVSSNKVLNERFKKMVDANTPIEDMVGELAFMFPTQPKIALSAAIRNGKLFFANQGQAQESMDSMVLDILTYELPRVIKTFTEGQYFIKFIKEQQKTAEGFTKEQAEVEFKNRKFKNDPGRFEKYWDMSQGTRAEASLSSYATGLMEFMALETIKKNWESYFVSTESFDEWAEKGGETRTNENYEETKGPETNEDFAKEYSYEPGYVDTTSPINRVSTSRKSAERVLKFSEETLKEINTEVDNILREDKIEDLDAREVGEVKLGSAGVYKIALIGNNQARVTIPGVLESVILKGSPSSKPAIVKIIKQLKDNAFKDLRRPGATKEQIAEAQIKFDEYSKILKNPPKIKKTGTFKSNVSEKVEQSVFESLSKDAGELGTPEYKSFIERTYSLFKSYISQSQVNKRFGELKEKVYKTETKIVDGQPKELFVLDEKGEKVQLRVGGGNAAGTRVFEKRNITSTEWINYFRTENNTKAAERRTSLLNSFAREIAFDRVMETTLTQELAKQVENSQLILNNKLEGSYLALMQKSVDRGVAARDASKELRKYEKITGYSYEKIIKDYISGLKAYDENKKFDVLTSDQQKVIKHVIEEFAAEDFNALQMSATAGIQAQTKAIRKMLSSKTNPTNLTKKEFVEGQEMILPVLYKLLPKEIFNITEALDGKGFSAIGKWLGYNSETFKYDAVNVKEGNTKMNVDLFQKISESPMTTFEKFELSDATKGLLQKATKLFVEANKATLELQSKKEKDGSSITINKNIEYLRAQQELLSKKRPESKEKRAEYQKRILETFKEIAGSKEGKAAILEMDAKKALLEGLLLTFGEMKRVGTSEELSSADNKINNAIETALEGLFLNYGKGGRDLSSAEYWYLPLTPLLKRDRNSNEHLMPRAVIRDLVLEAFKNNKLTNFEDVRTLTSGYKSLFNSAEFQKLGNSLIGPTGSTISDANIPLIFKFLATENTKSKSGYKRLVKGTLSNRSIEFLENIYNIRGKTAFQELLEDVTVRMSTSIPASKRSLEKNNKIVSEIIGEYYKGTTTGEALQKLLDQKNDRSVDLTATAKNSPEIMLPRELAGMIERRGGAKIDQAVSDSKAFNEGKKKGKYNFFLPYNAEDFQGLLYPLYGKGKQGNKDMEFIKENILRPYTRAENALSSYRMNLVVDYKALENQMKKLGDNKAEIASVKRVEKLGYNIDQAVRVYIWERLGKTVPGISLGERSQLVGAVHNSPRLRIYAKGIMDITKTEEKYPDPSANWFRSNVQYDLFTYATDGVRSDFLASWQNNVDAMFTKENMNKLEARFGSKYVKNLSAMMARMSKGKSRPESTNESFNTALNYVNGSVATIMFLNMRSAALQTISAANYVNWTDNNPIAIGKVIAEDPKLFFKTAQKIWNSDALKDRRTGLRINVEEAEMAKAINAGGRTNLQGLWDTMVKVGFKPTQMADSFAIVTGGTPFYMNRMKTYIKDGLSKSEAENKAFEDFLDLTQESQQSSQMDRVSNIQTGLMGRLVFSFNNTPFQMSRLQKKAALDLVNGRGDMKTNASKLGYYAFVQSTLFYGLQQGFYSSFMSDEDDNLTEKEKIAKYKDFEKRLDRIGTSTFQGILTGSGLPGKVAVTAYNTVREAVKQYDKGYAGKDFFPILNKALSISPTLGSKVSRMGRNWNSLMFSDFTKRGKEVKNLYGPFDPESPNNKAYLSMLGTATNIPLDRIIQKMENIQGVLNKNNENWEKVAMFFGAPKWSLQSAEENRSDMDERLDKFYKKTVPKRQRDSTGVKSLTKAEQIKFIIDLGATRGEFKKLTNEEERVNYILNKAEDYENMDLEKLIPKYETVKEIKTEKYKELEKLSKSQQVKMLIKLDITRGELKKLKTEEDRVKFIIKKSKLKSLK
tara:strand:+ start:9490 stop:18504 length:9015 start_codon:yes stop_codon:yes gene_type:complete